MNAAEAQFARRLGALLRAERMARGWTLAQAAGKFPGHLAPATLRSYEAGIRAMQAETFEKLAAFYGVPPEELIP